MPPLCLRKASEALAGPSFKYGRSFRAAIVVSVLLHLGALGLLIWPGLTESGPKYQALAVMDFSYYDPEGGSPGGGEGDEPSAAPQAGPGPPENPEAANESAEEQPEPETAELKAPPEPGETPGLITGASEEAVPEAPKNKAEEPKPQPRPKAPAKKAGGAEVKNSGADKNAIKSGGGQGRGGIGGGQGQGNPKAKSAYTSKIRQKLVRLLKYPPEAKAKRLSGVTTVNFTVNRQGAVISSRLVKSSGNEAFDREALAVLKRASPFSPMPEELSESTLSLTVPISFRPPK